MKSKIPIAVVGMAGMFPGAHDLPAFWHNIIHKIDSTSEVPKDRWIVDPEIMYHPTPEPDKAISKRACLIQQFEFDPEGLDLDRDILEALDPLYHIVLHTGREAFQGCVTSSIDKKRIGTILAAIVLPTDASSFIAREIFGKSFEEKLFGKSIGEFRPLTRNECLSSRVTSLPAAILARSLGLGGGSYTLDAACASSLYAVKLACDELISHRTDLMLAGGVSRPDNLYTQVGFSQLRALSPSGCCSPFDESADGLVVGEGAGILALKRLDDALRDGDEIFGLIRGMGLSNDLRGNLLAPDSEGQLRAMRRAYESAEWSPHDIDLIECHGTGTPAGDATELRSLRTLWGESGWSYEQCAIGSIKSMIGHLLTAAGAAGMIKTLLALKNKILPPSINFRKAPEGSPLLSSPFRVQTEAESWPRRDPKTPRHAAVSAFGFGGINAHLLFEEWDSSFAEDRGERTEDGGRDIQHPASSIQYPVSSPQPPPIAIIGMESQFGSLATLRAFQEAVFRGDSIIRKKPHDRWKGCDEAAYRHLNGRLSDAGYMDEIMLNAGEFRIPPNEIPDILPQHLLMLKVAAGAMRDAGLPLREERPRMGSLIGIDFDFNATDFHLRWNLHNAVQKWKKYGSIGPEAMETDGWIESLSKSMGEPLTPTRTLGALGGVIASRIAREFRLGGPSFGVSCEEASGLRALEIGIRSLQQNEMDVVLVGAVDLPGDVRRVITNDKLKPYARTSEVRPFDAAADGGVPGEGAAAVVLKRLDQALKDGDRIYAVIKGIGNATGGGVDRSSPSREAYLLSIERAFQDAGLAASSIGYFEAHGSGNPIEDNIETEALHEFFSPQENPCAIGSVKSIIGHCGAAAGIASLVKTSLCLYHEIIPPLRNFIRFGNDVWKTGTFHIPGFAQYWLRDRKFGPRLACIAAMTQDGNCMHAILEGFEYLSSDADALQGSLLEKVAQERKRPLGLKPYGLFIVEGDSKSSLIESLNRLNQFVKQQKNGTENTEPAARSWYLMNGIDTGKKYAVSIAARDVSLIENYVETAKHAVSSDSSQRFNGQGGICYSPDPLFRAGETVFVFPGSGNHYVGMGREIGIQWPEILRAMDVETLQLKSQFLPHCYVPHRISWERGWEKSAQQNVVADPLNMIFGQVVHGGMTSKLIMEFGIQPSAVIGYSLGESAGLFAMGAWPDRGEMLKRILDTNLFRTELAGPCNAARQVWNVPSEEEVNWCVAAVNRPADPVRKVVSEWPTTRLLIINTPNECVIGGRKNDVDAAIKALGCEAVYLEGVVTVHCDAAIPAKDAYKKLHIFPTMPPEGIRFYSSAFGQPYSLTSESAAGSLLEQALSGFDFPALIEQAYQDGIRMFLEMGPHASCTRMINRILGNKPHLAVSACVRGEDDYFTILKFLGALIAERVPVDLDRLYGDKSYPTDFIKRRKDDAEKTISIRIGGRTPSPALPNTEDGRQRSEDRGQRTVDGRRRAEVGGQDIERVKEEVESDIQYSELIEDMAKNLEATADAHKAFLDFSDQLSKAYGKTLEFQTRLLEFGMQAEELEAVFPAEDGLSDISGIKTEGSPTIPGRHPGDKKPVYTRDQCLEFAIGSVQKVLGPEFAVVDTYKARVRLPDEPLMLVDRILSVEGEKASLNSGRVVTEHDVLPEAWYLDGDRAPVCISVEAGQADLFLCAYLGIDLVVKGERTYRLLDATVKFHRGLPRPGDVIQYEIEIEKFVRQGNTYLFFFNFKGSIGQSHLITMTNGCAGFFTEEEVRNSGGIILTEEEKKTLTGKRDSNWKDLVPIGVEGYEEGAVEALRNGDLVGCFGPLFGGIKLADSLRLPGGRMRLIDRILLLDPNGGRYGLGVVRAEADIHPDDWFLSCHFMDDMVMPGTLMYECCAHALRVLIQRMGWVTDKPDVCYEPVIGVESVLKCRGPVTPKTRHVIYEVELKEIGYSPEPYVIADAHMYADGHRIVQFTDMSMKMTGVTREEIEAVWMDQVPFNREQILAFAVGNPSEAFGEPYRVFDQERFLARLPGPPYSFIDRVTRVEPEARVLKPDGWIEAEYDVGPDAWYFRANRMAVMPFCVLLEIGLQTCGFLAAYLGSVLKSEKDLKFRNLDGNAILHREVIQKAETLTMRSRLKQVSSAGDMIIEHFDMQILQNDSMIYEAETAFGFFTNEALSQQIGIRDASQLVYKPTSKEIESGTSHRFEDVSPISPDDPSTDAAQPLAMPARALRMIDEIEIYVPDGGPFGLGFIRGIKWVDPKEWFFKAHFYQDPVCPGSLGIESFLQLIKFAALARWGHLADSHRFEHVTEEPHRWTYRGQIIPENNKIVIEAVVTRIEEKPVPMIFADGFLKVDGLYIYKMENFGFQLVPI